MASEMQVILKRTREGIPEQYLAEDISFAVHPGFITIYLERGPSGYATKWEVIPRENIHSMIYREVEF